MYKNYSALNNTIKNICDSFTIGADTKKDYGSEISSIVHCAFLYSSMSWITEVAETHIEGTKANIIKHYNFYVPKDIRWKHFVESCENGTFHMNEFKNAVTRLNGRPELFTKVLSGELDTGRCTLYADGRSFSDVILSVNKLSFEEFESTDEAYDADWLLQYLIKNEIHRRQKYAYVDVEDFVPRYYEYCETRDISAVENYLYIIESAGNIQDGPNNTINSTQSSAAWKKKNLLSNIFSLFLDRYDYQKALLRDGSVSSKALFQKARKLFAYSMNEDDSKAKEAGMNYQRISDYFYNQPVEFFETFEFPYTEEELLDLLCDTYDKIK